MATVSISIPSPILTPPAYFKVQWRRPGGPWTGLPNQSNAPFTISLSPGSYELGVYVVKADGEICPESITPFYVAEELKCECITGVSAFVKAVTPGAKPEMVITFTPPASPPPCGWLITYGPAGGAQTKYLPLTIASPLYLPVQNSVNHTLKIEVNCCNGATKLCFEGPVKYIPPIDGGGGGSTPCRGLNKDNVVPEIVKSKSSGGYYVRFTFKSAPFPPAIAATLCDMPFSMNQLGIWQPWPGDPHPTKADSLAGTIPVIGLYTSTTVPGKEYMFRLNPSFSTNFGTRYSLWIKDCCNGSVNWDQVLYAGVEIG